MPREELETLTRVAKCLGWAENGVLPEAGGLNDQAATFVDAVELLSHLRQQLTEEKGSGASS
jgi:hypothetical protein